MTPDPSAPAAIAAVRDAGAAAVGIASVDELTVARGSIEARADAGLHDGMAFTFRNPRRSSDPTTALPSARSALVAAYPYGSGARPGDEPTAAPTALQAEVARYAAGDAYDGLRAALEAGAGVLRDAGHRAVVVADDNALVDRAMAMRAGLGWTGKNTNILVPGVGSWVVLGSVLTDAELASAPTEGVDPADPALQRGCGGCTRCLTGCPTGALVAPGAMDASRCLSWLLQRTGSFPRRFRIPLGTRIYGCDECQVVCPPSISPRVQGGSTSGAGPASQEATATVPLEQILSAGDDELLARFGSWYIPRRDPRYLRRNALVVLGNAMAQRGPLGGSPEPDPGVGLLETYLDDTDPLLVEHAAWAARRGGVDGLLHRGSWSSHPEVTAELARPHPMLEAALAAGGASRETSVDAPERR